MGKDFLGCYDLFADQLILTERTKGEYLQEGVTLKGLDDPQLDALLPESAVAKLREDVAMVRELCPKFDLDSYRAGHMTPVFFGSAVNNFGVQLLLDAFLQHASPPRARLSLGREIAPEYPVFSGFIFKIQANMDPRHRDRLAYVRVCSGKFTRDMTAGSP